MCVYVVGQRGWGVANYCPTPCWLFFDNSETERYHLLTLQLLQLRQWKIFLLFTNLNTNDFSQSQKQKAIWISKKFQFYKKKKWKIGEIWVADSRYLWFIWLIVFILSWWSQHLTPLLVFFGNFISSNTYSTRWRF